MKKKELLIDYLHRMEKLGYLQELYQTYINLSMFEHDRGNTEAETYWLGRADMVMDLLMTAIEKEPDQNAL